MILNLIVTCGTDSRGFRSSSSFLLNPSVELQAASLYLLVITEPILPRISFLLNPSYSPFLPVQIFWKELDLDLGPADQEKGSLEDWNQHGTGKGSFAYASLDGGS